MPEDSPKRIDLTTEPIRLSAVTASGIVAACNAVLFFLTKGEKTPVKTFLIATVTALLGLFAHSEYSRRKVVSEDSLLRATGKTVKDVTAIVDAPVSDVIETVTKTVSATPEVLTDLGGVASDVGKNTAQKVTGMVGGLLDGILGRRR